MNIFNFFVPNRQTVTAITQDRPGVVTTSEAHGYDTGLCLRFFFPLNVGMNQLKDRVVRITKIDDISFSIGVDTSKFDSFSPVSSLQTPQVIPVAEVADSLLQATENNENIIPEF